MPWGAQFLVALYTGSRRGELRALKWREVDWGNQTISVNATQTVVGGKLDEDEPKSKAGRRTISIASDDTSCIDAMKAHRAAHLERRLKCSNWVDNDLVFCSDRDTPVSLSTMYKRFYAFLADAGIDKVKFHSTRHTNFTAAMRAGINPKAVARGILILRRGATHGARPTRLLAA